MGPLGGVSAMKIKTTPFSKLSFMLPKRLYRFISPAWVTMGRRASSKDSRERFKRGGNQVDSELTSKIVVSARASIGRSSGSIHGGGSRRGRRRRGKVQQEEEKSARKNYTEGERMDSVTLEVPSSDMLQDNNCDSENWIEMENNHMTNQVDVNGKAQPGGQPSSQSIESSGRKIQQKNTCSPDSKDAVKSEWTDTANSVVWAGKKDAYHERPRKGCLKKANDASLGKKQQLKPNNIEPTTGPKKMDVVATQEISPVTGTIATASEIVEHLEPRRKSSERSECTVTEEAISRMNGGGVKNSNSQQLVVKIKKHKNSVKGEDINLARVTLDAERPDDVLGSLEDVSSNNRDIKNRMGIADPDIGDLESFGSELSSLHLHSTGYEMQDEQNINVDSQLQLEKLVEYHMDENIESVQHTTVSESGKIYGQTTLGNLSTAIQQQIPLAQVLQTEVIGQIPQLENELVQQDSEALYDSVIDQAVQVVGMPNQIVEQASKIVEQVAEVLADPIQEKAVQVETFPTQVVEQVSNVAEQIMQIGQKVVDQVSEVLPDPVVEQVGQVAEQISNTADQIVEQVSNQVIDPVTTTAAQVTEQVSSQIANFWSTNEEDDSDDEFEAYRSSDLPEFKGIRGLQNFTILQEDQGILSAIYDIYTYMLKKPLPEFVLGMFSAPILLSVIFTLLYLPEFGGLALDETAREFLRLSGAEANMSSSGLQLSWQTIFQVFMFSVSLSTGLQPELSPLSPYTLVVANLNALIAQLIFVFLSGAVFARLSQPSQPVRCSKVAVVCPPPQIRRKRPEACHKVLMARYVLAGPQPCELVDVKVDLTYKYNTITRSGTFFRATQSLKLMYHGDTQVRPEIAYLNHGMLVRHVIDETSPLYRQTPESLKKEDAIFVLSVVGLERSSMQSIFHVQHYCVYDGDVIWDADFEDMILINQKNRRIVDHSLLSKWKPVDTKINEYF